MDRLENLSLRELAPQWRKQGVQPQHFRAIVTLQTSPKLKVPNIDDHTTKTIVIGPSLRNYLNEFVGPSVWIQSFGQGQRNKHDQ